MFPKFLTFLVIMQTCPAQTNWVTVRDTREQAFSISAPKGWTVHGGMFRLSALDARPVVDMTSPDGRSNIRIGDIVPAYVQATPILARMGFTEGKVMPGSGSWPIVARFRSAQEYIAKYGTVRFASLCASVEATHIQPTEPRINKTQIPRGQNTAAEGFFTCTAHGQPMVGYVYGETWATGPGPGAIWGVGALGSFLAPAEQAKVVGELLAQSWKSWAFNPAWGKAQQDLVNAFARKSTADLQRNLAESQSRFDRTMRTIHHQTDNFNDILNGVTYTRDPTNGAHREVPTGTGGTHWMNGNNVVVESSLSPGPGFHQFENVSR